MDKNVKNVLAVVGAVAVVKAMPVLALGAAIGAVASNPDKVAKAAEKVLGHVDMILAKYSMDDSDEDEAECCCGGKCDCEEECCCDLSSEEDAQLADTEEAVYEEEPEVNVAPAVEIHDESVATDEEELNPCEEGRWGAT